MLINQNRKRSQWKWVILICLVTLYIVGRVLAIFTPEVSGVSLFVDEMPTGNITHDLDNGLVLYFPFYQTKPFAAGTVIQGVVAYPFMKLFGHSLFALKCSAVLFGLLTMILWFFLLWRNVGPKAATIAGAFFVFGPFGYINLTITAWGNHTESSLFTVASLALLFRAYNDRNPARPPPMVPLFFAGLIAGFGVYFAFTSIVGFLFGFLIIVTIGGAIQWRWPVWIYLGSAVLGALPILSSIRAYGLHALGRIDTYSGYSGGELIMANHLFAEEKLITIPLKFVYALIRDIPRSFCFPEIFGIKGIFISWGLYLIIVAAFILAIVFKRKEITSLLTRIFSGKKSRENITVLIFFSFPIFILAYLVIFSISGFRVINTSETVPGTFAEFRYFAPIFPFLFATAGVGFQVIIEKFGQKKTLLMIIYGFLALLFIPLISIVIGMGSKPHGFDTLKIRGDFYTDVVERMAMEISKHEKQIAGKIIWIENLPKEYQPLLFEKLGSINPSAFRVALVLASRLDLLNSMSVHAYRGYGKFIGRESVHKEQGDTAIAMSRILARCAPYSDFYKDAFLEGAGEGLYFALQPYLGLNWHPATVVNSDEIWNTISDNKDKAALMRGVGRGIGATFSLADLEGVNFVPAYWVGVGRQVRRNAKVQLLKNDMAAQSIMNFPPYAIPWVLKGWQDEEKYIFKEGSAN